MGNDDGQNIVRGKIRAQSMVRTAARLRTGGQPTPEAVPEAPRESQPLLTREQWMLTQPWRDGKEGSGGAVVCDRPPETVEEPTRMEFYDYYGGLCVFESCPDAVRQQIIRLHNLAIGYGQDTPVRPAVIDGEVA